MDINDLRALITVLAFVAFLGIVAWAYSHRRRRDFDEAARLPFSGNDLGDDAADTKTGKER